jgi:hypothetical protein
MVRISGESIAIPQAVDRFVEIFLVQSWAEHLRAIGSPVPSKKAEYQRPLPQKIGRVYLHVILIEQTESLSTVAYLQGSLFNPCGLELCPVARCMVSITSCGALYGGAPDSNNFLNSSSRS